jgi:hypothetical protein
LTTRMDEARARAEASFRKEERAKDGAMAMTEYQANIQLVREKNRNTARTSTGKRGGRARRQISQSRVARLRTFSNWLPHRPTPNENCRPQLSDTRILHDA